MFIYFIYLLNNCLTELSITQGDTTSNYPCIANCDGKVKKGKHPCYRPWRLIGLRGVKDPTLLRQTANRWRQGYQP
jgi:hypothetical protein